MSARAAPVGVPQTAAVGCRAAARARLDGPAPCSAPVASTPVTSLARCSTFGRCSTNGTSGTFVDEQNGSSACATDATAYSCSSRSFEECASCLLYTSDAADE